MERSALEEAAGSRGRPGRPKALPDADRRRAILDAAYTTFLELGFAQTTTAAVAARAKTSKRVIYNLFDNKTALFAAVIEQHRHVVLDLPRPEDEPGNALDILVRIFRLDIATEQARERDAMLSLIIRESALSPELSSYLYDHEIIRFREDLVDWLAAADRRGLLTVAEVDVCSGMLMDIVFGALLPRRPLRTAADRERSISHIKRRLEIFLRGIR